MRFRNNLIHFSHQLSAWYSIEYSRLLRETVNYFHAARPARKRVYEFFGLRSNVPPANPQEYRKNFFLMLTYLWNVKKGFVLRYFAPDNRCGAFYFINALTVHQKLTFHSP